jgi:hypothetical protein
LPFSERISTLNPHRTENVIVVVLVLVVGISVIRGRRQGRARIGYSDEMRPLSQFNSESLLQLAGQPIECFQDFYRTFTGDSMSDQYNKVIKRRRRARYLKRKKARAKEALRAAASKPAPAEAAPAEK